MKSLFSFLLFTFLLMGNLHSQDESLDQPDLPDNLPYHEIPAAPKTFTAETVVVRMIDGLGYRFFWATEGLTEKDLEYQASETSRATSATIDHIFGLSKMILNAISKKPNVRGGDKVEPELTFAEMRKQTLENLKHASTLLQNKEAQVDDMKVIFQRGEKTSEFPFWNVLNGPLADAMWHTGQIVANRRASGNPLHPGVSVFTGKTKF